MSRRVAFLIFPGFQLLDAAGPVAAFEVADSLRPGSYVVELRARQAGLVESSSGVELQAQALGRATCLDTLVVTGGDGIDAAAECDSTRRFVVRCSEKVPRLASVCSGAYLLAACGLLDGKAATTHWSRSRDFEQRFPRVRLQSDRIFVRAGNMWTSAGITAGIDLALALIAEDFGSELARRTAQQLVVYHRRPGGQSQFSSLVEAEPLSGRFESLLDFARGHLRDPLSVQQLAARVAMSPRNFARAFRRELGATPAKLVERLRAEAARAALQSGAGSIQEVATASGFRDAERMRRAFLRLYGVPPSTYKQPAHSAE